MRYRRSRGIDGPLFLARDTHALSDPATRTAVEVLVAGGVDVLVDSGDRPAPTPALSHAILTHNRGRQDGLADGIVVTPSHNPPEDGFKYNPPNGGPADTDVTGWIQEEANRLLEAGVERIERVPFERAISRAGRYDFVARYVDDLGSVLDMDAIRASGLRIGVDPLGGASVDYWPAIAERYGLDLTVTNDVVDPQFGSWRLLDWDGGIRMDPSSPYAMARLVALRDGFDIAFGNDADADRHGIVTPSDGLLNPNHVLSTAVAYLFGGGRAWDPAVAVGKTSRLERDDRSRHRRPGAALARGPGGVHGPSTGSSTGRWASEARKAPGRRSCAATGPSGPPTRTGSSRASSPRS